MHRQQLCHFELFAGLLQGPAKTQMSLHAVQLTYLAREQSTFFSVKILFQFIQSKFYVPWNSARDSLGDHSAQLGTGAASVKGPHHGPQKFVMI